MEDDSKSVRPPGIPDDYSQIMISPKDGPPLFVWGRVVETKTPDGRVKLTIEGFIPSYGQKLVTG